MSHVAWLAKFALVDHANVGRHPTIHLVLRTVLEHIAMLLIMFANVHNHLPHVPDKQQENIAMHHLMKAVAFANALHLLHHVLIL